VIKTFNQWLGLRCTNPNAEAQDMINDITTRQHDNPTVMGTKHSEGDEIPKNSREWL
jgi:hypothetical protein